MRENDPPDGGPALPELYRSAADWAEHRASRAAVPLRRHAPARRRTAVRRASFGMVAGVAAVAAISVGVPQVLGPQDRPDSVQLATGTGSSATPSPRRPTTTKPTKPASSTPDPTRPTSSTADPTKPKTRVVSVYLREVIGNGCGRLVTVRRTVPSVGAPDAAVQALLTGPTAAERRAGLLDSLAGSKATTKLVGERLYIDFAALPADVAPACRHTAVDAPVRRTAKQFDGVVVRLRITIRGSENAYLAYIAGK
jgi:hypothetical protein